MRYSEVNFDALVGPTHHYAGLAFGNLASESNAKRVSNPKAAALQGLQKMKFLMDLGVSQAVFPPHERPFLPILRKLGFYGKDHEMIMQVKRDCPLLLNAVTSASSMWMANAATITPSMDSQDNKVHITLANLLTHFHRAIETEFNTKLFKIIFSNDQYFKIHDPLFSHLDFADEGAANHNRFCQQYGEPGAHLFVYGKLNTDSKENLPKRNPARQTLLASESVARLHQIPQDRVIFAKQNPMIIDKGVFHNDVISVANQNVFLVHEEAFENSKLVFASLQDKCKDPFYRIDVSSKELSVEEAVQTYLFNSQIVTLPSQKMAILAPMECQGSRANDLLLKIIAANNPIQFLHFIDCRQSMLNGGGPACLRLRVVLSKQELAAVHPGIILNETLYNHLVAWVSKHYREKLQAEDFLDPQLLLEIQTALDELTKILGLGTLYNFQKI